MTVWVFRDGQLVEKHQTLGRSSRSELFCPMLSRLTPYESPITGKEITSWGERDREMKENNCYDPRDLPRDHRFRNREQKNARPDPTVTGQWYGSDQELSRNRRG